MILEIDTKQKTIKVTEVDKIGDLMIALEEMFPDGTWAEFKLVDNVVINYPTIQPNTTPYFPPAVEPWGPNPLNPINPTWQPPPQVLYISKQDNSTNLNS